MAMSDTSDHLDYILYVSGSLKKAQRAFMKLSTISISYTKLWLIIANTTYQKLILEGVILRNHKLSNFLIFFSDLYNVHQWNNLQFQKVTDFNHF